MLTMKQIIFILIGLKCLFADDNFTARILKPTVTTIPYPKFTNLKEESAALFLQQHTSGNPVVMLIDNVQECHEDASKFLSEVYKLDPVYSGKINFMIMKFNTSGVTSILETSHNNYHRFVKILQDGITKDPTSYLGGPNTNTTAVYFGILNAAHLLLPNSAIVTFIKRKVEDEDLARHTLADVVKKQIRVFIIWGGKDGSRLLRELALRSGGNFFINTGSDKSKMYYEKFLESIGNHTRTSSIILSRRNLLGDNDLIFPIDSDVTGIHISITPNITRGIITTPKGYKLDIFDCDEIVEYSIGSFMKRDVGLHDIHLNTTSTQDVGVWHFRVGNARIFFNITIFVHTQLTTNAYVILQNTTEFKIESGTRKKVVKLGVTGDISSIKNITFVNKEGKAIVDNVKFDYGKICKNCYNENTVDQELKLKTETIPNEPFYAVVNGKDGEGKDFTRLSYVRGSTDRDIFYLPPLTVDVGIGSELITQQMRQPEIYFEVTNNGNTPTLVRFSCKDERSILLSMNPWFKWISPQDTATVRVTLTTKLGIYKDLITFTAYGVETVEKKVIVDVGTSYNDQRDPELHYDYTSNCLKVLFGACEDGTWTIEVKAKDTGSGLFQVISKPRGIYFPQGFTTGTNQEIVGYFSESCCYPKLQLIALDRANNRKIRNINAYEASLGPEAITAIVFGIILLILLIILIVYLCKKCLKKCCKSENDSYELPTYRAPRRY